MSKANPWPPTPDAPLLESIIDEIGRLRRRVEQLEIENRTHARMDSRLTAVEGDVTAAWQRLNEGSP